MFTKYSEIENSYNSKNIEKFRKSCSIDYVNYFLTEKIHGACFSICVTKNGEVSFKSRNRFLDPDEKFYDYKSAIGKIDMERIISFGKTSVNLQLFGELYGDGVQKGLDYSRDKRIRFFDVKLDNVYLNFKEFTDFMGYLELPAVPIIAENVSLNEALEFDVENFKSRVNPDASDDNIAEGIVIKPMFEIRNHFNERFILKKKSKKFTEKKQKPKSPKTEDPIVNEWKPCVEQFVTESRMDNLFSKEGEIEDPKEIGKYIKLYMEDVYKDFIKEYPEFNELELSKKQKKSIMNVQGDIVKMLQKGFR